MGKCVSNKIGHPFSFGFDVVTGLWQDMMVVSFIDTNVTGLNVMKNTLVSQQEPSQRGLKNIKKPPFPIYDHSNISGHAVTIDKFSIEGREDQNIKRAIKEAIYIRRNNPSLKKNIGKYHLT